MTKFDFQPGTRWELQNGQYVSVQPWCLAHLEGAQGMILIFDQHGRCMSNHNRAFDMKQPVSVSVNCPEPEFEINSKSEHEELLEEIAFNLGPYRDAAMTNGKVNLLKIPALVSCLVKDYYASNFEEAKTAIKVKSSTSTNLSDRDRP